VLSPIPLSRGGTLLVLDVASLPREVQALVARVARKQPIRDGGDVADARLVVTVRETVDALVARGRLLDDLGDALGDRAIPLPPLSARAEDVRPLALDHLARIGLALRGEALGLADDALEALLEHPFPGNDLELSALLLRAARVTSGPAVTRADLVRAGLSEPSPAPSRAAGSRRR
jgi:DNA-binding NtrC family response regulator